MLWIGNWFNADPDKVFYLNADSDPDPESQTNADLDPDQTLLNLYMKNVFYACDVCKRA